MNTTFYHIYLSGNNYQDIFYKDSDFIQIINRLALAANEKQTQILAYIFHHNHFHLVVKTDDISGFMHYFRMSLTHWFHRQYGIEGSIGMRKYGKHIIKDEFDMLDILKYVLRNEVRHKLASDPFDARWSSIRSYFKVSQTKYNSLPDTEIRKFLPWGKNLPEKYRVLDTGLIDPDTFIEIQFVETLFGSRAVFLKSMYVESVRETKIKARLDSLKNITAASPADRVKDKDILEYAHTCVEKKFTGKNILQLSSAEKYQLAQSIKHYYKGVSLRQLSRILSIPRSTLWEKLGGLATDKCPENSRQEK